MEVGTPQALHQARQSEDQFALDCGYRIITRSQPAQMRCNLQCPQLVRLRSRSLLASVAAARMASASVVVRAESGGSGDGMGGGP